MSLESTNSAHRDTGEAARKLERAEKVDAAGTRSTEERKADGEEKTDVAKELKDLQARIEKFEERSKDADNKAAEQAKTAWDIKLGGHIQMDYITCPKLI